MVGADTQIRLDGYRAPAASCGMRFIDPITPETVAAALHKHAGIVLALE